MDITEHARRMDETAAAFRDHWAAEVARRQALYGTHRDPVAQAATRAEGEAQAALPRDEAYWRGTLRRGP